MLLVLFGQLSFQYYLQSLEMSRKTALGDAFECVQCPNEFVLRCYANREGAESDFQRIWIKLIITLSGLLAHVR